MLPRTCTGVGHCTPGGVGERALPRVRWLLQRVECCHLAIRRYAYHSHDLAGAYECHAVGRHLLQHATSRSQVSPSYGDLPGVQPSSGSCRCTCVGSRGTGSWPRDTGGNLNTGSGSTALTGPSVRPSESSVGATFLANRPVPQSPSSSYNTMTLTGAYSGHSAGRLSSPTYDAEVRRNVVMHEASAGVHCQSRHGAALQERACNNWRHVRVCKDKKQLANCCSLRTRTRLNSKGVQPPVKQVVLNGHNGWANMSWSKADL